MSTSQILEPMAPIGLSRKRRQRSLLGVALIALVLAGCGDDMATVTLGLTRLVTQFRIIWPQLMAGSTIGALPSIILYLLLQNYLVRGLTAGAVKQ